LLFKFRAYVEIRFNKFHPKIRWILLFAVISMGIGWLLIAVSNKNDSKNSFWVNHTYQVISVIDRINILVAESGSVQARYAIKGKSTPMKQQFYSNRETLQLYIDSLQALTRDNPVQQQNLLLLTDRIRVLHAREDQFISAPASGMVMDRILSILHVMKDEETNLLIERERKGKEENIRAVCLLICGSLLTFGLIIGLLHQLNKDMILRRKAEEKQHRSESKYRNLVENAAVVIYSSDRLGNISFANDKATELTGYSLEELTGMHFSVLVDPARLDGVTDHYMQQVRSGKPETSLIFPIITRHGEKKWVEQSVVLETDQSGPIGFQCIVKDISEQRRMQEELIRATRDAEDAKKMQEQFLANMSHEIRTPLNGIQGMTNLLLETPLTEQQTEFAQIVRRSSNNLLVIVNDILDFSKIKAGKLSIEKIDFSLTDILDNVKGVFRHRVKKKGLELSIETDPSIPGLLRGDPYRLNQVLVNLVGNAIKFTEKGEVRVIVQQKAATAKGAIFHFSVTDTGIGISEENLPRIFDSFSQAGVDTARRYGGTGLGLAICQQLVRLQGGQISVASAPGKGSSFDFEIPYDVCEDGRQFQKSVPNIYDHAGLFNGRRFLVAEDNEVNQTLIEHVLRKAGGMVEIAVNGQEAIDKLRENPDFDVIIMDLQMPVLDGYAASRFIRGEMKLGIPIVAMTATALKGEQQRCLDAGMNEYMTKPFEFADLYRCIAVLLGKKQLPAVTTERADIRSKEAVLYDLSLLEEMDDKEYLRDILVIFLTNTPLQLQEISEACVRKDFEKVYYLSHKLKGSAGMLRSVPLQDLLSKIEEQSKERMDTTEMIKLARNIYDQLEEKLKEERSKVETFLSDPT
jgi:PAS domain S-box-containing protein